MRAAPAIGFHYRASRLLIVATLLVASLAFAAVWLSGLPHWAHLALSSVIVACTGGTLANLLRPRVSSILWRAEGGADLVLNDRLGDRRREAQGAIYAARVMRPLIVLTLRWPPHGRASLWLLPDNLDADTRRRLRMRVGARVDGGFASGNTDSG
ncbi:MAG TPA: protein YgfX [Rhodanobacteraceae bacterium]|nr:protein YgfX [Rhodanobacteraceae bacterium]